LAKNDVLYILGVGKLMTMISKIEPVLAEYSPIWPLFLLESPGSLIQVIDSQIISTLQYPGHMLPHLPDAYKSYPHVETSHISINLIPKQAGSDFAYCD
jgi:hypothetical protein